MLAYRSLGAVILFFLGGMGPQLIERGRGKGKKGERMRSLFVVVMAMLAMGHGDQVSLHNGLSLGQVILAGPLINRGKPGCPGLLGAIGCCIELSAWSNPKLTQQLPQQSRESNKRQAAHGHGCTMRGRQSSPSTW